MNYQILCEDSINWLNEQPDYSVSNFLTGMPDLDEIHTEKDKEYKLDDYKQFFKKYADLIFKKLSKKGYAIFIQTDRKIDGIWFDKSYYLTNTAYDNNVNLLWHKIVLQREIGKIHLQRPTYSHVLCYSYTNKPKKCFQDVFEVGEKLYSNATPLNISNICSKYLADTKENKNDKNKPFVVDLFVGRGTIGLSVLSENMSFLGIDIDQSQCDQSLLSIKKLILKE